VKLVLVCFAIRDRKNDRGIYINVYFIVIFHFLRCVSETSESKTIENKTMLFDDIDVDVAPILSEKKLLQYFPNCTTNQDSKGTF